MTNIYIGSLLLSIFPILTTLIMGHPIIIYNIRLDLIINPIILIIVGGYSIKVIKNTFNGINVLPSWDNFTEIIEYGLQYTIAFFILILILYCLLIFFSTPSERKIDIFIHTVSMASLYSPFAKVNLAKKGFLGFFNFFVVLKHMFSEGLLILMLYYFAIFLFLGILLQVMFSRAVAKYYIEKEKEQ